MCKRQNECVALAIKQEAIELQGNLRRDRGLNHPPIDAKEISMTSILNFYSRAGMTAGVMPKTDTIPLSTAAISSGAPCS